MKLLKAFLLTYADLTSSHRKFNQEYHSMTKRKVKLEISVNTDSSNINFIFPLLDNLFKPKERFIPEKEMHMRSKRYFHITFIHRGWSIILLAVFSRNAQVFIRLHQFDLFGPSLPFKQCLPRSFRQHRVPIPCKRHPWEKGLLPFWSSGNFVIVFNGKRSDQK